MRNLTPSLKSIKLLIARDLKDYMISVVLLQAGAWMQPI
jgi:hypothetical protein